MTRSRPIVAVAAAVTLGWGVIVTALGSALDWNPLVAPGSLLVPIATFGLLCRGRDVVDAMGPCFIVSYAGYLGIAAVRAAQSELVFTAWTIAPLSAMWPAILLCGVPFALIWTIAVALPASRIPVPSAPRSDAENFWNALAECNARAARRASAHLPPQP